MAAGGAQPPPRAFPQPFGRCIRTSCCPGDDRCPGGEVVLPEPGEGAGAARLVLPPPQPPQPAEPIPPGPATTSPASKPLELVEFRDQPLGEALRLFRDANGLNIVASPDARKVLVSLYLRNVTPEAALDALCKANDLWYKQDRKRASSTFHTTKEYQRDSGEFSRGADRGLHALVSQSGRRGDCHPQRLRRAGDAKSPVARPGHVPGPDSAVQPFRHGRSAHPGVRPKLAHQRHRRHRAASAVGGTGGYGGRAAWRPERHWRSDGSRGRHMGMGTWATAAWADDRAAWSQPAGAKTQEIPLREEFKGLSPEEIEALEATATGEGKLNSAMVDALMARRRATIYVAVIRQHNQLLVRTSDEKTMQQIQRPGAARGRADAAGPAGGESPSRQPGRRFQFGFRLPVFRRIDGCRRLRTRAV